MVRQAFLIFFLLGVSHFAIAGCNYASLAKPRGDKLPPVLLLIRAPETELWNRPLDELLEIAETAILARWDLSRVDMGKVPQSLLPTRQELEASEPSLRYRPEHSLSPLVRQGFQRQWLEQELVQLSARIARRIADKATPDQRIGFARKLFQDLPRFGSTEMKQVPFDKLIDAVLGIHAEEITRRLREQHDAVRARFGSEETWVQYGNANLLTRYLLFHEIVNYLDPKPGQTVVDIGSGMGRSGIYLGITRPGVKSIGYEIVPERVQEGVRVSKELGLGNTTFHEQNLAAPGFRIAPADFYYAYDPTSGPTFAKILDDLRWNAAHYAKPFKLIVSGPAHFEKIESQKWLREVTPKPRFQGRIGVRVFEVDPRFLPIPLSEQIRAEQAKKRQEFLADAKRANWGSVFRKLPDGLEQGLIREYGPIQGERMFAAYEDFRQLMDNHTRFFDKMQELERLVEMRNRQKRREASGSNLAATLREVLAENERRLGFPPARVIDKEMSIDKFLQVIADGVPFDDMAFDEEHKNPVIKGHGILTHRIQLWAWSTLIEEKYPEKYNGKSMPVLLFREMGNTRTSQGFNWDGTGFDGGVVKELSHPGTPEHLWNPLTDAFGDTFSSPEFLVAHRNYFPGLGNWK